MTLFHPFGWLSLKEHVGELAGSKHGSRTLDALWKQGSVQHRAALAEALSSVPSRSLSSTQYGMFIQQNYGLQLFKIKKDEWMEAQTREAKNKRLFSDIIQGE